MPGLDTPLPGLRFRPFKIPQEPGISKLYREVVMKAPRTSILQLKFKGATLAYPASFFSLKTRLKPPTFFRLISSTHFWYKDIEESVTLNVPTSIKRSLFDHRSRLLDKNKIPKEFTCLQNFSVTRPQQSVSSPSPWPSSQQL